MTTRIDIDVEYNSSPRIIEVDSPSVEMNMQDLVDTLRKQEDSFEGMSFDKLLNASGKQDLGNSVSVGITVSLQDMKLAFEGRTTPAETGQVTGSPAAPHAGEQILQDNIATFIANSVARGSLVINFTDRSIADVISVDSETQLTTKTLVNGLNNVYGASDFYHVFNIIQVKALGGNLTAVDSDDVTISAVLPTAFTQVLTESSSSATLLDAAAGSGGLTAAELVFLTEIYERLDLEITKPNVYANDGSKITGTDFTLTRTDDGTDTTIQRS